MTTRLLLPWRLALFAVLATGLACNFPLLQPTPTPTAPPVTGEPLPGETPTHVPGTAGSISGVVWHDQCDPGPDGEPAPATAPAGCAGDAASGYHANGVRDAGEPSITGVKVTLASGSCSAAMADVTTASGEPGYAFIGLDPGTYCLVVDPLVEPNLSVLVPGNWTYPEAVDGPITASVTLGPGENKSGVDFGWDYQFAPGGTPAGTPVATAASDCVYQADFVADVTAPDDTIIAPGTPFVKTWRLRNAGTCPWGPGLPLGVILFTGGHQLGAPDTVILPRQVEPGDEVDVSVDLVAPSEAGLYRGEWKLLLAGQQEIGVGPDGQTAFFVQIVVPEVTADGMRLVFPAGADTVTVQGQVASPDRDEYVLRALAGQEMTVEIESPGDAANFAIVGLSDGQPLKRLENEDRAWSGALPGEAQDYRISVAVPGGVGATDYSMVIVVASP